MKPALFFALLLASAPPVLAQGAPALSGTQVDARLGKGLSVRNETEGFELTLRTRFHVLASYLDTEAGVVDEPSPEISVRRARLILSGQVLHDFAFYMHLAFSGPELEEGVASHLLDAYATWTGLRDLNVRAGQMKVPFDRQRLNTSSALQLVDRSIIIRELTLDRDAGVALTSDDLFGLNHLLGYQLGVYAGEGRNRTTQAPGLLFTARVEVMPLGNFEVSEESDLERTPAPRLALGAAVGHHGGTRRVLSTTGDFFPSGRAKYQHATADVHFKWSGFSLLTSALYRRASREVRDGGAPGAPELSRSGWGYFVQSGVFLARPLELTARYSELRPLAQDGSSLEFARELGGGMNWFIVGREVNLQTDYFYLFRERFAGGDHQVRLQTQLYF